MRQLDLNAAYQVEMPPTAAVLTAEDLHAQLRIDAEDEDELLAEYIRAATELVETDSRLYLRPCELTLMLDRFPQGEPVYLHRCPVTAVSGIRYIDPDGGEQEWEHFHADLTSRPARIEPDYGCGWPAVRRQAHAIAIAFDCGFVEGEVPPVALQMVRLLVGHWFEQREAAGSVASEIAFAYSALLERLQWQG